MHKKLTNKRLLTFVALILLSVTAWSEQPLLIPGKHSLYQRILTIPGAQVFATPEASTPKEVTPFTSFYVYERTAHQGQQWLRLGANRHGDISGWIKQTATFEWNQGLTAVFRNPAGHNRALLFKNKRAIMQLAKQDAAAYKKLYQQAITGTIDAESPVIAIQPPVNIDIQKDFYLLPIHEHQDIYLHNEAARMLKVASIPLTPKAKPQPRVKAGASGQYSAGLVFVIDSSLSMDEYIERTNQAVLKIYDQLGDAGLLGQVNFGLVAFRDSVQQTPELEYLSKTYVTLEQGADPGKFITQVQGLSAATVSSTDFREDAYAGMQRAIAKMDWSGQQAKYIVLVTDAGAREGNDPQSGSGMDTAAIRKLAHDKGIAVFVLHLRTPAEMADHTAAAAQYKDLSDYPGIGSLYYGVPTGNVAEFGEVLDSLATQIATQVGRAVNLELAPPSKPKPQVNTQLAALQSKVSLLGYALQMQYLQKPNEQLPTLFKAWILDRDFADPERKTLDVRVLLSRNQLSDLHDVLQQVLVTAEEGLLSPQNFLNELKSLSATISRDPSRLGSTTATTAGKGNSLADLGFLMEYTADLPYTSEVMDLSLDDWQHWPAKQQIRFLNRLEEKISYYKVLHDHTDLWVSLDNSPVDGDAVFPIPLEMLP